VEHHGNLQAYGRAFSKLVAAKLVRGYESGLEFELAPGFRCRPLPLRHDSGATFGFRLEVSEGLFGQSHSLGYLTDLGSWTADLADGLADVDLLAMEFNHDVALEIASGRSPYLKARVLGDEGHLSNEQAVGLLREILRRSTPGRLRHVVQLHLSRECNHPTLAAQAARAALTTPGWLIQLHTAHPDRPSPTLVLGSAANGKSTSRAGSERATRKLLPSTSLQPYLPGLGLEELGSELS
jgi:hypothetical protein